MPPFFSVINKRIGKILNPVLEKRPKHGNDGQNDGMTDGQTDRSQSVGPNSKPVGLKKWIIKI